MTRSFKGQPMMPLSYNSLLYIISISGVFLGHLWFGYF